MDASSLSDRGEKHRPNERDYADLLCSGRARSRANLTGHAGSRHKHAVHIKTEDRRRVSFARFSSLLPCSSSLILRASPVVVPGSILSPMSAWRTQARTDRSWA